MMPVARPLTPRTELHTAVANSSQRTLGREISSKFDSISKSLLSETQQKYPDFKPTLQSLLDDYNPDTLRDGLVYDENGETVSLSGVHEDVDSFFHIIGNNEKYTGKHYQMRYDDVAGIIREAKSIAFSREGHDAFRAQQNDDIEIYHVDGAKENLMALDGQRGVRFKRDLPKDTLIDVIGGQIRTSVPTDTFNKTMMPLYDFVNVSRMKYDFGNENTDNFSGGITVDGQTLLKMMNSNAGDNEKKNTNLLIVYFKAPDGKTVPVGVYVTSKDVKQGEQVFSNYAI